MDRRRIGDTKWPNEPEIEVDPPFQPPSGVLPNEPEESRGASYQALEARLLEARLLLCILPNEPEKPWTVLAPTRQQDTLHNAPCERSDPATDIILWRAEISNKNRTDSGRGVSVLPSDQSARIGRLGRRIGGLGARASSPASAAWERGRGRPRSQRRSPVVARAR